jgi:hypothetical protein
VGRRRFDHLVTEISLVVGRRISRYRLWLSFHELGWDPERLSRETALSFCGVPLTRYLAGQGIRISARGRRRLSREVQRFDPSVPTPYERMARI